MAACVAAAVSGLLACGGGSSPSGPSDGGGGGGGGTTPVETDTITITGNGVSPRAIMVNAGTRVRFVNNDSRPHEMSSNPHPDHTDCPELNIGVLNANESRQTAPMVGGRTCGFHDHLNDTNASLRGTVTTRQ